MAHARVFDDEIRSKMPKHCHTAIILPRRCVKISRELLKTTMMSHVPVSGLAVN